MTCVPITPSNIDEQKTAVKHHCIGEIFIATEELFRPVRRDVLRKAIEALKERRRGNIVTITKDFSGELPAELEQHTVLDFSDPDFKQKLKDLVKGQLQYYIINVKNH